MNFPAWTINPEWVKAGPEANILTLPTPDAFNVIEAGPKTKDFVKGLNPNYVNAPYEVSYAFFVPLKPGQSRRARLKAFRRFTKQTSKLITPHRHYEK